MTALVFTAIAALVAASHGLTAALCIMFGGMLFDLFMPKGKTTP